MIALRRQCFHLVQCLLEGRPVLLQPDSRALSLTLLRLNVAKGTLQGVDALSEALALKLHLLHLLLSLLVSLLTLHQHLQTFVMSQA